MTCAGGLTLQYEGKWSHNHQNGEYPELCERTAILKSLRLSKLKLIDPDACPVLVEQYLRQGTMCQSNSIGDEIAKLVEP